MALVLALLAGATIQGVPTKLGFFRWAAHAYPDHTLRGLAPAMLHGAPWGFDFERLGRLDLSGQTALVTGANSGLGYASALHLARQGARVVLACRSAAKCADASARILASAPSAAVVTATLDTSSFASVRAFAEWALAAGAGGGALERLDMLMLNAGLAHAGGDGIRRSVDGLELVFATNHAGHQLLYELLLPRLLRTAAAAGAGGSARVVVTASAAHYGAPLPHGVGLSLAQLESGGVEKAYAQSKLANVLFAQEAARRLSRLSSPGGARVFVNSCHPGAVDTGIWSNAVNFWKTGLGPFSPLAIWALRQLQAQFMWSAEEGALTQLWLATPEVAAQNVSGRYFHPQAALATPSPFASNLTLQTALWNFTRSLYDDGWSKDLKARERENVSTTAD